ncbi:hypothetical protein GCM10008995_10780 [Halobellus salinus]|uniref:Sialidase n=1 Tax=Halobellus salinus TaxID=931585 RepID=A0A830EGG4_9EURY|nr:COG1361 S-layer family protein [Halobellus salinus]GGJ02818.1 hypothetical protein GCM10008995_10780 [Halobellus salinus]SMP22161.1 Uncharacterized conserved protein [Halobellus salinus]
MKRTLLVVAVVASLLVTAVPAVALTSNPDLRTVTETPNLQPGGINEVSFQLLNDPDGPDDDTRAATNVRVKPRDTGRIDVETGELYVPSLPDGDPADLSLRLNVPADLASGTYRIPLDLTYEYDNGAGSATERKVTRHVTVRVESGPRFSVVGTNSTATVDGQGILEVTMRNVGDTAAHDSTLTLSTSSTDISLGASDSSTRFVSEWEQGENRTFAFDAVLGGTAVAGNYSLDAQVDFEKPSGTVGSTPELTVPLEAHPEMTFRVSDLRSTLSIGGSDTLSGTITNTGPMTAHNAVVRFNATSTAQAVGGGYAVGSLAPGESAEFSFRVSVDETADAGPRQFGIRTAFRNANGDKLRSDVVDIRVPVDANDPGFEVQDVESTLRVGEEGTLDGTIVNTREDRVTNAVVTFEDPGPTVTPIEDSVAIGDLGPGEAANFSFDVEVTSSSDAGPRQFDLAVSYRDEDNAARASGDIPTRVGVGAGTAEFDVEPVDGSLSAGSGGEFRVTVTNTREYVVSDLSAKIYTDSPLSTSDDEAFVDELGPGESTTITFQLSADGGATEKTYPVKMDFQYDDEDSDTIISDTYQVPVDVAGSSGGLPVTLILVAVVLLGGAAGGVLYYRRRE